MARPLSTGQRLRAAREGVRVEQITVAWMTVEATLSIGAGIVAHSLLLVAFGLDSATELVTAVIPLGRLSVQARARRSPVWTRLSAGRPGWSRSRSSGCVSTS